MVDSQGVTVAAGTPRTDRGRKTRAKLLEAASVVFQRDGFLDTKITDITGQAGAANGTFYNYFNTKEEILAALVEEMLNQMYAAASIPPETDRDPLVRIQTATTAFVRAYSKYAGLLGIFEQVATFNDSFRETRIRFRHTFRDRTARGIARLQADGQADPSISARCAAEALTSMMSNTCYVWLVLGETYEESEVVETLVALWARGIGLKSVVTTVEPVA